jgi:hypothetical protein
MVGPYVKMEYTSEMEQPRIAKKRGSCRTLILGEGFIAPKCKIPESQKKKLNNSGFINPLHLGNVFAILFYLQYVPVLSANCVSNVYNSM